MTPNLSNREKIKSFTDQDVVLYQGRYIMKVDPVGRYSAYLDLQQFNDDLSPKRPGIGLVLGQGSTVSIIQCHTTTKDEAEWLKGCIAAGKLISFNGIAVRFSVVLKGKSIEVAEGNYTGKVTWLGGVEPFVEKIRGTATILKTRELDIYKPITNFGLLKSKIKNS